MRIRNFCITMWSMVLLLLTMANIASAAGSGAFRVETPDAGAFGKGSAFIGEANTSAAVYYNPAGQTQLHGNNVSVGIAALQPLAKHEDASGNETQMGIETFWIPHVYAVSDFGLDKLSFGVGAGSNWGLVTDWPADGFSRYVNTKSEISNMDTYFTTAYEVTDQFSLAGSFDVSKSKASLEKKLYQGPSNNDADFQLKGDDVAFGYRVATMYHLNEQHQFGLMYRSSKKLKYEGHLDLNNFEDSPFLQAAFNGAGLGAVDYTDIFGGSEFSTRAKGEVELPQSIAFGYSYRPNDRWVFNFDVEWFDWASTEQLGFNFPDVTNPAQQAILASGNPAPKDWNDAFSYAIGGEYSWNDHLRLRAGYYFHQSVIPESNWDPSIPDASSHGVTLGFGYDLNDHTVLDVAYSALLYHYEDIGNNVSDPIGVGDIDGKYKQLVNMAVATLSYNF